MPSYPNSLYSSQNLIGNSEQFPDPFQDVASLAMPTTMRNALHWCQYIYMLFGTYRMAMERIVSYFLTDIKIGGDDVSDDEKDKYEEFFKNTIDAFTVLQNLLRDRMCFHGDVKTTTRDGVFKLRDLAGKTVDVLSEGGSYRPATFKSFGRQELLEVAFSDGRTILATPEHRWVALNCSSKKVRVPTTTLTRGYRIERTVAPRPLRNEDFKEGVRHGFTFGDGTGYNDGNQCSATFFGAKDSAVLPYFAGYGCEPVPVSGREDAVTVNGLASHYKQLPENHRSPSYWHGFVCGFLAADGSVDTYGCALLTQKSRATLEVIAEQLPRIGMAAGPVRGHWRTAEFIRADGTVDVYEGYMHYVTLLKRFVQPGDLLIPAHREKFTRYFKPTAYGKYVGVKEVRRTGIFDEVFCCVEPETHTFVVDQAVLTSNCYGNSFASIIVPFRRFLLCRTQGCGMLVPLRELFRNPVYGFSWQNFEFHATCPKCKRKGAWQIVDKPDDEEKKLKIKRWSPHEMELLHDPYTDDVNYVWRIPEDYKKLVRDGNLFHLERASKEVLKAIQHNHVFRFNQDVIFHMKEPTLAGIRNRGWGIPRIISNFRQIYYVQVLRRFNEAIALDYVIPFRLITPQPRPGAGGAGGLPTTDPLMMFNGGDFRSQVMTMIRKRRRDPAGWHVLPYPVQYQILGGDAANLAPRDLLDQGLETLLNDAGTPVELYKGSLQLQTAPVALRLFESTWHHLVHDTNMFLQWLVNQVSQIMSWEVVEARLEHVTIADDMQKQMAALQLMMGQQLSGRSGLGAIGYDWDTEQKRIGEESRKQQEIQARIQEEMEQAGFAQQIAKGQPAGGGAAPGGDAGGGGAGAGGAGGGAAAAGGGAGGGAAMAMAGGTPVSDYVQTMGPNTPITPNDLMQSADQLAQELLGLPEGVKDSELRKLKQYNEVLHSLVRAKMDATRRQARTQGGAMVMQQQFGQGGAAPAA